MGNYKIPAKVKLIIGFLYKDKEIFESIRQTLLSRFGPEEEILSPIPFTWTNYYEEETGSNPLRVFISYESLIDRETIVEIKRYTNMLENEHATNQLRPVNIDPGYMTLGQFFLATTKDQRQRVYVGDGIFVEVTLYFMEGAYYAFPWTYRDYRSDAYHQYFLKARKKLAFQLKTGKPYSKRLE